MCVRVSLSVFLHTDSDSELSYVSAFIPGLLEEIGGEEMGEDRGGREAHPQPGPWLAQLHRPSGRGPGGLAGAESDPCRLGREGMKGREGGGVKEGGKGSTSVMPKGMLPT